MKRIFAVLLALLPLVSSGITLTNEFRDINGSHYSEPVLIQPLLKFLSNGTYTVSGPTKRYSLTNGILTVPNLHKGLYRVQQNSDVCFIAVPDGSYTYNLSQLATNGVSYFAYSGNPGGIATNVIHIAAGNGVNIVTNSRVVTISVSGASAVAASTGISATTNGGVTTVAIDTNRVKSIERRVYITDGDSVTAGDSWFPIFLTNSAFAAQGTTISSTNFAIASDGVGFGHPDSLNALSYRALSSVVVAANGTATATLSSAFNSDIRRFVIRSTAVPGLTGIYTITPTGQPFTTFTFQTTGVSAQTINDARLELGAVSRYASFIRPIVTNAVAQGYVPHVIFFLGLNDGGLVYQTGDNSGLTNYWAPAYSNLLACARADGAKISVVTLHRQSSIWNSASASARYLQNDWIRTANVGGRPMYDTLVDWEAAVPNTFDTRFFTDGLHVTALGKRAIAQAVDTALLAGDSGAARITMNSEMAEAKAYFSAKTPEGVYNLPRGTLVIVTATNGNPAVVWQKVSATGANGWEPMITSGTATNITDGTILKSKLETPVQNVVNNAVTNGSAITAESLTVDGQTPLVISNGVTTAQMLWGDLNLKPDGSMFGIGWQFHANGDIATGGKFYGDGSSLTNLAGIGTNLANLTITNLVVPGGMDIADLNAATVTISNWPAGHVRETNIVDGAVTEAKLSSAVQTKLNAAGSGYDILLSCTTSNATALPVWTNALYSSNTWQVKTDVIGSGATNYLSYSMANTFRSTNSVSTNYQQNVNLTGLGADWYGTTAGAVFAVKGIAGENINWTVRASSMLQTNGVVSAGGGGSYTAYATTFNGSSQRLSTNGPLAGVTDSDKGLLSFWIKLNGGDGAAAMIIGGDNAAFRVQRDAANKIYVLAKNSGGSYSLELTSTATITADGNWHHILVSWDLSTAGRRYIYIDDTAGVSAGTFTVGSDVDLTDIGWGLFGNNGSQYLNACVSEFYFAAGQYLDLSVETNRRKFNSPTDPVSLGSDGSTPTGSAPSIYLNAAYGTFNVNAGTAGNLTIDGGPLTSCTAP